MADSSTSRKRSSKGGRLHDLATKRVKEVTSESTTGHGSHSDFVKGAIIRVKLKNFLTYDDCEFRPGPHLNVIVGPNGTGKSSLVCALCLGLAGKPSVLARAKEIVEFVKHGCQQASIEIELYNPEGRNTVIQRDINKNSDPKSVWRINGASATEKLVVETVSEMNVQISNLCQFLPQDRVVEFAKMSPQRLLEATQEAVGPPGLLDDHQRLIEMRKSEREQEKHLKSDEETLSKLEQRNAGLEHDVKRYQERQKHMEKIEILQKKKPWAEYEVARKMFLNIKDEKDNAKKQLDRARKENEPMRRNYDIACKKVEDIDTENKQLTTQGNEAVKKAKAKSDSLEKLVEKFDDANRDLKDLEDQEKSRLKKISDAQKMITNLCAELEKLDDPETLKPRVDEINHEVRKINHEHSRIQQHGQSMQDDIRSLRNRVKGLTEQMRKLEDQRNRRLEQLRSRFKDTYNAVMWLRDNQDKFQAPVYEPIVLQINMGDVANAKYIESLISADDMRAFVFESREDIKLFMSEVRDKQNLKVNAVSPPDVPLDHFKPNQPIDALRRWGFNCYLSDLFKAPDAVMKYICHTYNAHNIPLGTEWTVNHADQVLEGAANLRLFFTPSSKYIVKRSVYSGNKSVLIEPIRDATYLNVAVDMNLRRNLETELQAATQELNTKDSEYKSLQDKQRQLGVDMEKLKMEKKGLQSQQQRRRTLANQIETKRKGLESMEKDAPNIKVEEEKIRTKINNIHKDRAQTTIALKEQVQKCVEVAKNLVILSLQLAQSQANKSLVEKSLNEKSHQLRTLEEQFAGIQDKFKESKQTARHYLKTAQQKTNTPDGSELSDDLKAVFSLYPDSVDEIEEMIHDEQARADSNYQTDPKVIQEYQRRKKEIETLRQTIQAKKLQVEEHQEELAVVRDRWLTPLKRLLSEIDEKYQDFFRRLGCAGEVGLSWEGENNYEKCGIQIKVKFRAKDVLHALTPHHQSGGERSVSTMLYLMALQELNKCPFRVVDEINQGMDPNNERKVFEFVVQTACRPDTPQYFLITPKLLPDLTYSDKMRVLCVFNAQRIVPHNQWSVSKFLDIQRRLNRE